MIDTYILALKKKPLTFLQMYHHTIIVVLCWSWLYAGWSLHWCGSAKARPAADARRIGLLANTVVHVFMYYYFALSALGINVWWKKVRPRAGSKQPDHTPQYLTALQLVQFSLVFSSIAVWWTMDLQNFRFTFAAARPCLRIKLIRSAELPFFAYDKDLCAGTFATSALSQGVTLSFLYLFGEFYVRNYLTKGAGKADKAHKSPKKQE